MHQDRVSLSRRTFIKGASALAAPFILSTNGSSAAANEKISIATIGNGKMMLGSHLPHFIKMPELQVVAVCDVDTTRREAAKKRVDSAYGNRDCMAYNEYREILARDDIDAVAIATPDHWHALIILDACKAGKDIYCEKPLTNNLAEAKTVMDAIQASDIVFQTGSQQSPQVFNTLAFRGNQRRNLNIQIL
jgi:predicted dehydrogenase